jgi:hypothetical protein
MRIRGMGRSIGALASVAVLVGVCGGCTVQAPDGNGNGNGNGNGGGGGGGKGRSPVHITVPSKTPSTSADGDSKPGSSPSKQGSAPPPPPGDAAPAVLMRPGDSGREVRELQARLRQVAWLFDGPTGAYDDLTEQAVRGFQGKRGLPKTGETDTVTWQRLLKMTHEPGKWDLYLMGGQPADAPDSRCMTGRVLCISKSSRTLRWMVDGRTLTTVSVRFGSQYTPTREGVFHVYWKSRHHVSTLYDSPMPYAMFFSGGQAVHYSSDFAARGYAGASHGCVNVGDERAIADLFGQVRTGDKVVVHW